MEFARLAARVRGLAADPSWDLSVSVLYVGSPASNRSRIVQVHGAHSRSGTLGFPFVRSPFYLSFLSFCFARRD